VELALLLLAASAIAVWAWVQPAPAGAPAGAGDEGSDQPSGAAVPCPEQGGDPVTEPQLVFPAPRLDPDHAAALEALAAASEPLPCGAIAASGGAAHDHGGAGPEGAPPELGTADGDRFAAQWQAAQAAAATLATPDAAAAAGYVKASPQAPGVGTHWIDWRLVDAPFDPAHPSMLLFDERAGRPARLAGFSYWTRSADGPPDGFAGDADVWHSHLGLCFIDGWLFREDIPAADGCTGQWLAGPDLWMLHAWVVDGLENPDGPFAGRLQALCPGDREQLADALRCDPTGT
jgi:hypothetical protein